MKQFFTFLLVVLTIANGFAQRERQEREYMERQDLRINPTWLYTYQNAGSTGWIYDAAVSKKYGLYSTGAYSTGFYINDSIQLMPKDSRDMTFYLIKQNTDGSRGWVAVADGKSVGRNVLIEENGDIVVAGAILNKTCKFFSPGKKDSVTLESKEYLAGFIIRYSAEGKILQHKVLENPDGYDFNSLESYGKKGYLLAGVRKFRNPDKKYEVKNGMVLMVLDKDFNVEMQKTSTGNGNDACVGATSDKKGNIYLAIQYSERFKFDELNFDAGNNNAGIIIKFNKKGKIEWEMHAPGLGMENIHADAEGNLTVTGRFGSMLQFNNAGVVQRTAMDFSNGIFIMRIDKDGKVLWCNRADSRLEFVIKDSYTDEEGNTVMAGGTNGCRFYSRNEQDSLDINEAASWCARYDKEGKLSWLKSFNKHLASDYMKLGVDEDQNVYICGHYHGNKMQVGDSIARTHNGTSLIYAFRYNKADLENKGLKGKVILPKSMIKEGPPFDGLCQCTWQPTEEEPELERKNAANFLGSITSLYDSADFFTYTGMKFVPTGKKYNGFFYKRMIPHTGSSSDGYSHSLDLVDFRPVPMRDRAENFDMIYTPCKRSGLHYVHAYLRFKHRVLRYNYGFDHTKFNNTVGEFYKIFLDVAQTSDAGLLASAFMGNEDPGNEVAAGYIKKVNAKYKLQIKTGVPLDDAFWENVAVQMEAKKIEPADVVFAMRFKANKNDIMSERVAETIQDLFRDRIGGGSLKDMYRFIYPEYDFGVITEKLAIHLPSGIVNEWDIDKRGLRKDSAGKNIPLTFSLELKDKQVEHNTWDGWKLEPKSFCFPHSVVGETGLTFKPLKLDLMLDPSDGSTKTFHFEDMNKQLKGRDPIAALKNDSLAYFTGFGGESLIIIYDGDRKIRCRSRYAFNNHLFAGEFSFSYDSLGKDKFMLNIDEKKMELNEFIAVLKKAGIKNLCAKENKEQKKMYIGFIYRNDGKDIMLNCNNIFKPKPMKPLY